MNYITPFTINYIEQAGVAVMLKTSNPEGIRFETRPKTVWSVEGMRNFSKVTTAISTFKAPEE
jgi:hypothetical protein